MEQLSTFQLTKYLQMEKKLVEMEKKTTQLQQNLLKETKKCDDFKQ